jgi:hypothetical protein
MKNRLFIFGRFAHDPQSVLAAIACSALVSIECRLNSLLGIGLKLRVATFAHAEDRRSFSYDSQFALWHEPSLAHLVTGAECP